MTEPSSDIPVVPLDAPPNQFDEAQAIKALVAALRYGYLTLFIGAGVSQSASGKFPGWLTLAGRCCNEVGVEFKEDIAKTSNEYVRKKMFEVRSTFTDLKKYLVLVEKSLYADVEYNHTLMAKGLLIALGSLVMSSVRGAARAVVTYNYDDLLEWYLDFHGFRTQAVSDVPELNMRTDVTVYHPHGFLPKLAKYKAARTKTVILDEASYKERATDDNHPWNELQRTLLASNLGLFVGTSGDDPQVTSLCWRVYNKVIEKRRVLGFIFLRGAADKAADIHHHDNGLVPIYYSQHSDLPGKLLDITRTAASLW